MKHLLSVLFLPILLPGAAFPQTPLSGLNSVTIELRNTDDLPLHPGVFSRFQVIDQRADTARIGIHTYIPTLGHSHNRQLVFRHPAAAEIAGYLNQRFARPGAPWSALIVLRNLWLSDANYLREDRAKDPDIAIERTHIRLKAEIYAVNGNSYIPVFRFDTLQSYKRNNPYNNLNSYYYLWANDLSGILSDMADSAAALTPARTAQGRRLKWEDILQFNRSRFEPAITAAPTPVRGVYASFQEFRDNAPSIRNFEVRQEGGDHLLYIMDGDGASHYSHNAWGYCDGKELFIMRDGKLYPLTKEGKAFYFTSQAYKEYDSDPNLRKRYLLSANDPLPPTTAAPDHYIPGNTRTQYTVQRIYSVDMDTGVVY